jgi:hypothetical protein
VGDRPITHFLFGCCGDVTRRFALFWHVLPEKFYPKSSFGEFIKTHMYAVEWLFSLFRQCGSLGRRQDYLYTWNPIGWSIYLVFIGSLDGIIHILESPP